MIGSHAMHTRVLALSLFLSYMRDDARGAMETHTIAVYVAQRVDISASTEYQLVGERRSRTRRECLRQRESQHFK